MSLFAYVFVLNLILVVLLGSGAYLGWKLLAERMTQLVDHVSAWGEDLGQRLQASDNAKAATLSLMAETYKAEADWLRTQLLEAHRFTRAQADAGKAVLAKGLGSEVPIRMEKVDRAYQREQNDRTGVVQRTPPITPLPPGSKAPPQPRPGEMDPKQLSDLEAAQAQP